MKVVIVDDHPLFRLGLRHVLASLADCQVVGEAETVKDALDLVESLSPDLVLMDVVLRGPDGVVGVSEMRARFPRVRVLTMSAHAQLADVVAAMNAGAAGFLVKSDGPDATVEATRNALRGERYVSPSIASRLAGYEQRRRQGSDLLAVLTAREREVFRLAAECRLAREIASELAIARKTVDTHLTRINRKLGLRSMAELVRLAASLGFVTPGAPVLPAGPADSWDQDPPGPRQAGSSI
jgi:DNA-binding NarL/FixJ family response regulator